MPTTASTATIRAWAQSEGLDVAERGRLKPEILDAYATANGGGAKKKPALAKTALKPKASRAKPAASKAPRPAAKPVSRVPVASAAEASAPEVVRVAKDTRVADLQDAVTALTARVANLETAAAVPSAKKKFGRKS